MMLFNRVRDAADDLRRVGREEIEKAHAAGVPAYVSDGDGIIRQMLDGSGPACINPWTASARACSRSRRQPCPPPSSSAPGPDRTLQATQVHLGRRQRALRPTDAAMKGVIAAACSVVRSIPREVGAARKDW